MQKGPQGRWSSTHDNMEASPLPSVRPHPQESRLAQHTIQALQSELDSLRADNVKLFEKIKFLQSYPGRVSALPSSLVSAQGSHMWTCGQMPVRTPEAGGLEAGRSWTCWSALGLGDPQGHTPLCQLFFPRVEPHRSSFPEPARRWQGIARVEED
jgi:hypothetical protein